MNHIFFYMNALLSLAQPYRIMFRRDLECCFSDRASISTNLDQTIIILRLYVLDFTSTKPEMWRQVCGISGKLYLVTLLVEAEYRRT